MPVDTTRVISTRRTQKQISEEELKDIEIKRLRGELSCAECRRLKLKCDKNVPCGSCVRRGCDSICPCGILLAGQGTRFILADTDQLHQKISDMSTRIRQLEDALAILQASISDERHPLLNDDMLKVKFGGEALGHKKPPEKTTEPSTKEVVDAFGTLALGEDGKVIYYGRSAGSETLMLAEAGDADNDNTGPDSRQQLSPLPAEVEQMTNALPPFLSSRAPTTYSLEVLGTFLPDHRRALGLCDNYVKHATFFFRPIKEDELFESLLPQIYKTASALRQPRVNGGVEAEPSGIDITVLPHALSSLFFIFALGALLDINLPPYNEQAERYYNLGTAALSLRKTFSPTSETVLALGLMAAYHGLAGKQYSRDSAWCIMSVAAKSAQSFGLHRDSARWGLDAKTVQKRRNLFWEIFSADVSHSLAIGRPPSIHLSFVDCEYPEDKEATISDSGEVQSGFWKLKHDYARNIFYPVVQATLSAEPPDYNTILDLDRKVREMSFPTSLKPYLTKADGDHLYYSSSLSVRDFYASQNRTVTMLYLHRSFFAQAMLDHPSNPLQSPFAPSFLTAYRCASIIIKASAHQFDRCEELAKRIWFLLYHTFSAAIIAGTIVTRIPNSSMAPNALKDLNMAVLLFQKAAPQSQRARVALVVLKRLQDKATKVFNPDGGSLEAPPDSAQMGDSDEDLGDIDLAMFGGQARILTKKPKHRHSDSTSSATSPVIGGDDRWKGISHGVPADFSTLRDTHDGRGPSLSRAAQHSSSNGGGAAAQYGQGSSGPGSDSILSVPLVMPVNNTSYSNFLAMLGNSRPGHGPPHAPSLLDDSWRAWESIPSPTFNMNAIVHGPQNGGGEGGLWQPGVSASLVHPLDSDVSMQGYAPDLHHGQSVTGNGRGGQARRTYSSGSDGYNRYDPAVQYDFQENTALLSSFGLIAAQSSSGPGGVAASSSFGSFSGLGGAVNGSGGSGGGGELGRLRMPVNPATGAIELGLSGESRLDSNWLEFMKHCGILGTASEASYC